MHAHCQRRWRRINIGCEAQGTYGMGELWKITWLWLVMPKQFPWLAGSGFPGAAVADAMEFRKLIYKHYIRVLLIKTNWMIYNMLYKISIKVASACSLLEMTCLTWGRQWRIAKNKARVVWGALEDHVVGRAKASTPAGWLQAPGRGRYFSGVAGAKELHKWICNHYIHVLLIKTNQMVYNMLYKI